MQLAAYVRGIVYLLDRLDRKILKELVRDSRRSNREIARKVNVSIGTVLSRIRRLQREGIIKGYSAVLDHERMGYDLTAVTEITVSRGRLVEMEKKIASLPNVCAVYDITGLTDAIIISKFENRLQLSDFTKTLLSMPFVERTNTHVVLTTVKEDFRLLY